MPIDYAALAKKHGGVKDIASLAAKHGGVKQAAPEMGLADQAGAFLGDAWDKFNPIEGIKGLAHMAAHPIDTISGIGKAQGQLALDAKAAFDAGDYLTASRKAMEYLIPVLGPEMSGAGDEAGSGKPGGVARGLGQATGIALGAFIGPESIAHLPNAVKVGGKFINRNLRERAAMKFANEQNIPVSAGVQTGNQFVRGLEKVADTTPLGSLVAEQAAESTQANLRRVGGELANQVHPEAVTPMQAGESARKAVHSVAKSRSKAADVSYDAIRDLSRIRRTFMTSG